MADGHLGHYREVPGLFHTSDGFHQLVGEAEGFQNEQIHAPKEKTFGLLPEKAPNLLTGRRTERFDSHPQGAHGSRHQCTVACHTPGRGPILKAKGRELGPAGPVRVRLENLGSGFEKQLMDLLHQLGPGKVEFVETPGDGDAPVVEFCAESAVKKMGSSILEESQKAFRPGREFLRH